MKNRIIFINGFTLIEMLIVVTIIGILAAILLPRVSSSGRQATQAAHKKIRTQINSQIELFYFNAHQYPSAMTNDAWNDGTNDYTYYWPEGVPTTCNYSAAWTIDASTHHIVLHDGHE